MDGTLVDTEPSWIAAEYALAAKYGGEWSHADALELVGSLVSRACRAPW
jgi:beta-phosphoglucomutase-like phosphatase (HAD superfamily)